MARIIEAVEAESVVVPPLTHVPRTRRGVLSYAARDIGERLTPRRWWRSPRPATPCAGWPGCTPPLPLLAFTSRSRAAQLALTWGERDVPRAHVDTTDEMVRQVDDAMLSIPGYHAGDTVVIVAGSPPDTSARPT